MIPEPQRDEVIQSLLIMRSKIAKGYCRKSLAVDSSGKLCSVYDREACAWSLNGALLSTKIYSTQLTDALASAINKRLPPDKITNTPLVHFRLMVWDDTNHRGQQEVLEVIDEAIDYVSREAY